MWSKTCQLTVPRPVPLKEDGWTKLAKKFLVKAKSEQRQKFPCSLDLAFLDLETPLIWGTSKYR